MNARILLLAASWMMFWAGSGRAVTNEPIRVFMPDGQIKSHLLRVFVTRDFTEEDAPKLMLLAGRLVAKELPTWVEKPIDVRYVARFQHRAELLDGIDIGPTGTLLVFDLRDFDFPWFKACMRVTPVIKWGEPSSTVVGEQPVYIGNLEGAMVWTLVVILLSLGLICLFAYFMELRVVTDVRFRKRIGKWMWLLARPDGRLSLSKTQAAIWTICVGAMVFCFGITRLKPPVIPESLVALMGLSLATRAVTYLGKEVPQGKTVPTEKPKWRHLIDGGEDKDPALAITRAQMLFWTILVVCLFCAKSLLDGELWKVPWQLVALMGLSQTSYIVPVLKEPRKGAAS
jgi:hypothetical protein